MVADRPNGSSVLSPLLRRVYSPWESRRKQRGCFGSAAAVKLWRECFQAFNIPEFNYSHQAVQASGNVSSNVDDELSVAGWSLTGW